MMKSLAVALAISGVMVGAHTARADRTYQLKVTGEYDLDQAYQLPSLVASVSISGDVHALSGWCHDSDIGGPPTTCSLSNYDGGAPFVLGPDSPPFPISFVSPVALSEDFLISFDLTFGPRLLRGSFNLDNGGTSGLTYYNPGLGSNPPGGCYEISTASLCYIGRFVREGAPVPEPSSAALLVFGLLGTAMTSRVKPRAVRFM